MRAEPDAGDFIIRETVDAKRFFDVAGIKSPGLTAAPAIAVYVVSLLEKAGLNLNPKNNFNPFVKENSFSTFRRMSRKNF